MKTIVLDFENEDERENYTTYACGLIESMAADMRIIRAEPDINRYDAVLFVYESEYRDDCRLANRWVGHSHFRAVCGSDCEKKSRLKTLLRMIAGIPAPLEIERKFLIEYPSRDFLENLDCCKAVQISQTYLESGIRVRMREADGKQIYIKTEKKKISSAVRIESEEEITQSEYEKYIFSAGEHPVAISKTRYCLLHEKQYFEIDVFPFWKDKAYLEIELTDENENFCIPPFINVLKEVTNDSSYTNRSLARALRNGQIQY